MKYLLLILPFLSFSQHDGRNLHYIAGAGISIMTGELALSIKDNNAFALSTGIVMGTCAGIAKEQWDKSRGREFDKMDAMTTTWGALNGAIMLRVIIDIREKKREKKYYYHEGLD